MLWNFVFFYKSKDHAFAILGPDGIMRLQSLGVVYAASQAAATFWEGLPGWELKQMIHARGQSAQEAWANKTKSHSPNRVCASAKASNPELKHSFGERPYQVCRTHRAPACSKKKEKSLSEFQKWVRMSISQNSFKNVILVLGEFSIFSRICGEMLRNFHQNSCKIP